MRVRDSRPPFAGLANLSEAQLHRLPTPCYLLDEAQLCRNGEILLGVQQRTGCRILLAQKAFSNFNVYPVLAPYLAGTEASGLYESRLGREELPEKENHVFCAAYRADEFEELLQYADHIVFNSPSQLAKFGPAAKAAGKSIGLRINPECSTQEGHEIYDPCAPGSRLGTTRAQWDAAVAAHPELPALLDAGLDSVNISLDTLRPEVFRQITARDDFAAVQAGLQAALESGLTVKLNCVPQAGVNEDELEALAALAKDNALQVRFIEMMPIGYGAAMPCISGPELRARFAWRWPELAPLSTAQEHALGDGPAVYYTVPGWQGSIGFIAAVHGKFCASCNRVRLTSQGFLRPCLASETGCDLRALLRSGADDAQLLAAIRETIWAKPREHHFNDSSMPATRCM